jgi:hypothetical protein
MKKILQKLLKYPAIEIFFLIFWAAKLVILFTGPHKDSLLYWAIYHAYAFIGGILFFFISHIYEFIGEIIHYEDGQALGIYMFFTAYLILFVLEIVIPIFVIKYFNKWKKKFLQE